MQFALIAVRQVLTSLPIASIDFAATLRNSAMFHPPARINPDSIYLDPWALRRELKRRGWARTKVKIKWTYNGAHKLIADSTLDLAFTGQAINRDVAKKIADHFEMDVLKLLAPWDADYRPPETTQSGVPWEWQYERHLQPGVLCANGLHYCVCKLRHRNTSETFGRGKYYHLSGLSADDRTAKYDHLRRHANVCAKIGLHPHVLDNLAATPIAGDQGWWVVDRWIDGYPLSERLEDTKPYPAELIPRLMQDIAAGLAAMHAKDVVLRELTPERVWIATDDRRALLTDFELAKLLGQPTVSAGWPLNTYRAPEIEDGVVKPAADCFSWGQILYVALTGQEPPPGGAADLLHTLPLPKKIWAVARDALSKDIRQRPKDGKTLAAAIASWKAQPR